MKTHDITEPQQPYSNGNGNMEWNNNLRNSSESKETTTTTPAFYKKTAPDPPPKLASSLTNGRSHSKMDPPKEFGQFSALLAPALLSGKKNEEGETVRSRTSTLSKKVRFPIIFNFLPNLQSLPSHHAERFRHVLFW